MKNAYSLHSILKLIGQVYSERLSSSQNINNPLYVMIYDLFLNRYGLKKICESKYFQVFNFLKILKFFTCFIYLVPGVNAFLFG